MKIKKNLVGYAAILALAGCVTDVTPPPKVVVVDPPFAKPSAPARTFDYTQHVETGRTLIDDERAKKFVSEFKKLFFEKGNADSTFLLRVIASPELSPSESDIVLGYVHAFGRVLREGGVPVIESSLAMNKTDFHPAVTVDIFARVRRIEIKGFDGKPVQKVVPDVIVQATQNGFIVGQASAADLIGDGPDAWVAVERVGPSETLRATALVLLEDMVLRKMEQKHASILKQLGENPASVEVAAVAVTDVTNVRTITNVTNVTNITNISQFPAGPPPSSEPKSTGPEVSHADHPKNPDPIPEAGPLREISAEQIRLIDNLKATQEAQRVKDNVKEYNAQCKEVEAWQLGLLRKDQTFRKPETKIVQGSFKNQMQSN